MSDTYVWYSPATDVTGKKIQENLGCDGGTKKPAAKYKNVLCWGTKTDAKTVLPNDNVFNHPDNIRINRNKLQSLGKFKDGNCNIAPFTDDFGKAGNKDYPYPLVARTKYHQGGAGFWLCLNKAQVDQAVKEGAQYLQTFIDIKNEYRLHVVDGEVVYAVRKAERDNHRQAFEKHWSEHCENFAAKNKIALDKDTVKVIMGRMSRKMATGADMVVRSNTRGWKFVKLNLDKLNKELVAEAVKALAALNLNYGAVDCCIGEDGKPYIIECNTGPGLEGSSLEAWTTVLKKLVTPVKKAPKKAAPAAKAAPVAKAAGKKGAMSVKDKLRAKTELMNEMIDAADENEAEALQGLWAKMGAK